MYVLIEHYEDLKNKKDVILEMSEDYNTLYDHMLKLSFNVCGRTYYEFYGRPLTYEDFLQYVDGTLKCVIFRAHRQKISTTSRNSNHSFRIDKVKLVHPEQPDDSPCSDRLKDLIGQSE